MHKAVGVTTRPPRSDEREGHDYRYIPHHEYAALKRRGAFVATAATADGAYGLQAETVSEVLTAGFHALLDVVPSALASVRRAFPRLATIFLLPPSLAVHREQILSRGLRTPEDFMARWQTLFDYLPFASSYEYVLINTDSEQCADLTHHIVAVETLRTARAEMLEGWVQREIGSGSTVDFDRGLAVARTGRR